MVRGASAVLSKARKTRGIPRGVIRQVSRGADPAAANGAAPDGSAAGAFEPAPDTSQHPGSGPAASPVSRRALKNWRVRSRLFLLVVIPTVTAVAAGGVFIASSVESATVNQRVLTLANLSGKITGLVQALQNEREDTVRFIVLGSSNGGRAAKSSSASPVVPPGPELGLLKQDYAVANAWASQVKAIAGGIGGGYPALARQDTQAAVTAIGNLPAIRAAATGTQLPALIVIGEYATTIDALLAVESQIAVGSSDSTLAGSVRVLSLVSSMKEEASQQQALLTSALRSDLISLGQFGPTQQSAIIEAQAQQQGSLNEFDTAATAAQQQLFSNVLSSPNVVQAQAQEQEAISLASSQSSAAADPTISDASAGLSYVVSGMRSAEDQFANSVISRSGSLRDEAITSAVIYSLAVALLLGIALVATAIIGQSMVGPLRKLRNGALDVAEARLPEMVRRMSESDGGGVSLGIEPIDVDSLDEIGEVARAFDQVHREAVRLAANEAALRGNVNAMFVNLSRRSQSLVERQIRVITHLERSEQDSERLASLFQVDHLATRMRRNSENLLVLAGQELSRRWGQPVALVDVLRAAVSEIEQYERVTLNAQPGISIRREAVRDVVHLTAELVENATSFSAAQTPVTIQAQLLSSGGALIEIADQGVGMRAEPMAQANSRLDTPPVVDVEVSRRMGLFVVAQLAARHGIRVRLRPVTPSGLSALVWLPYEVITDDTSSQGPLRPASTAPGNGAAGQDAGIGRGSVAPAPRRAPLREHLGISDPGRYPPVDDPARDAEPWAATTGPLSGMRGRMRASEPGAGSGSQSADRGQGSGDQRTRTLSAAAEAGQYVRVDGGSADWGGSTPPGEVVVPPGHVQAARDRLPIYEAVESDWFSRGGQMIGKFDQGDGDGEWYSPADDGYRAAEAVKAPTSDGTTRSGLPKRAPGANLIPGTAAASAASTPAMSPRPKRKRSATDNRNRFASYQRGIQQGRAAAADRNPDSGVGTVS
jgi:signal transduction histidine kinase